MASLDDQRRVGAMGGVRPWGRWIGLLELVVVSTAMWVTKDVNLPDALLAARVDRDLVLFVGAGVSTGSPSGLPLFGKLTELVYAEAKRQLSEDDHATGRFDQALGQLKDDHDVDVHATIARTIGDPTSLPNAAHRAVVDLALASRAPRIVTTNYDLHLSSFAGSLPTFAAPALPVGDDFTGVVYLHGSLANDCSRLIATDTDFGAAYLRDAWAARFLERMFRRFTVLFIGYSHNDVVMSYLGRSLPRDGRRFVLTDEPDHPRWRLLGITPVGFPVVGDDYSALDRALAEWARLSTMAPLDEKSKLEAFTNAPGPPLEPHELDYLAAALHRAETTRFFTASATGEEWLRWAAGQPAFERMLSADWPADDVTGELATWFSSKFLTDANSVEAAFSVLHRASRCPGPILWMAIANQLKYKRDAIPSKLFARLVALLVSRVPPGSTALGQLLLECELPADSDAAQLLLDEAIRPSLGPNGELRFATDEYELTEAWSKKLAPALGTMVPELLIILESALDRSHCLLRASDKADSNFDPVSFGRSAIEPHEQDHIREPIDAIIDALRDTATWLASNRPDDAAALSRRWFNARAPVVRRLAVHTLSVVSTVSADDKIQLLLTHDLLFQFATKHEVFQLLQTHLPSCSEPALAQLAERIETQRQLATTESQLYEVYNLIQWIRRAESAATATQATLDVLQNEHPDWMPRPHPDLDHYISTGFFAPQQPMTPSELHQRLDVDPTGAILELAAYRDQQIPFAGPTWHGALGTLQEAVSKQPSDLQILLHLPTDLVQRETMTEILGAGLAGFVEAQPEPDTVHEALELLSRSASMSSLSNDLARALEALARREPAAITSANLSIARELAAKLWPPQPQDDTDFGEPLADAINHPVGQLAEFWLHSIRIEWQAAGQDWTSLSDITRATLESMLADQSGNGTAARTVIASQLHFLFAADESWATEHVLPLLDYRRNTRDPEKAWDGFLTWGRWSNRMLTLGLLTTYIDALEHLAEFPSDRRRQLLNHLAAIAIYAEPSLLQPDFLQTLIANMTDEDAAAWTYAVSEMIGRIEPDEAAQTSLAEEEWKRWMRAHYERRASSRPRNLGAHEAAALATWIECLDDSFPDAIGFVVRTNAGLEPHSRLLFQLNKRGTARRHPQATADALRSLLSNTPPASPGSMLCHYLNLLVTQIHEQQGMAICLPVINAAITHCPGAGEWLA